MTKKDENFEMNLTSERRLDESELRTSLAFCVGYRDEHF